MTKLKNSFQNVVNRISAGFVAVVVMCYSLLFCAVPGRGVVHADDDMPWINSFIIDVTVPLASTIVGALAGAPAGVACSVLLGAVRPVVSHLVEGRAPVDIEHDLFTMDSWVGQAERSDTTRFNVNLNRFWSDSQQYSDLDAPLRFSNIVTSEDFSVSFIVSKNPDWTDDTGYITVAPVFYRYNSSHYRLEYNIQSDSTSHPINVTLLVDYGSDYTDSFVNRSKTLTFNNKCQLAFRLLTTYEAGYPVITSNFPDNLLNDFSGGGCNFHIATLPHSSDILNNESVHVGHDTAYQFPVGTVSDNYSFVDYYNNQIRNYVNQNFYDYPTIIEKNTEFVIPSDETTEPTGTGAVIIIDPFTLPPEWVESDVVELNTEAYTIDYDTMIDEPLDEINYPLTPTNPLRGGANILSFGIQFLKDGGVFYIICTLLVIGLLIRFLGI